MMTSDGEQRSLLEEAARLWTWVRKILYERPFQFIGYLLAAATLVVVLGYSLATSYENNNVIDQFQNALCRGDMPYTPAERVRCRNLLNQLLKDPSPQQRERLREIVKER